MLLGGAIMEGPRHISWNLVSLSKERVEQAKVERPDGRFAELPGGHKFIPQPER
jgi:redox-sensitive bicupin YhaK (pirin superfamily)